MSRAKASQAAPEPAEHRPPEDVREYNFQVWDMVLHLVNPTFLYVLLQILILSHLGAHALVRRLEIGVWTVQFLGAWSLFYATLMRDMGFKSFAGPILGGLAIVGAVAQFFCFPRPLEATDAGVIWFLAVQYGPVPVIWVLTLRRWRHLKRLAERDGGGA